MRFAAALFHLKNGKKIAATHWASEEYLELIDGKIVRFDFGFGYTFRGNSRLVSRQALWKIVD